MFLFVNYTEPQILCPSHEVHLLPPSHLESTEEDGYWRTFLRSSESAIEASVWRSTYTEGSCGVFFFMILHFTVAFNTVPTVAVPTRNTRWFLQIQTDQTAKHFWAQINSLLCNLYVKVNVTLLQSTTKNNLLVSFLIQYVFNDRL